MHAGKTLPEGVERVEVHAKGHVYTYYYWNPHRGTPKEGERIKLPNADKHPGDFWREVDRYSTGRPAKYPAFSVGALVEQFMGGDGVEPSEEWKKLSESTQSSYAVHANRFKRVDVWGMLPARGLRPAAVQKLRDEMKDTAPQANHMLAFGRSLWNFGIPLDYAETNPFVHVKDLDTPDRGHVPWPQFVVDYIRQHATEDLVRMMKLGIMTCQRESDLIRLGPGARERAGVWCRPKKTRKKRRSFLIPLTIADVLELDRWESTPIVFTNPRWKKSRPQHNRDLYLYSPRGVAYSEDSLRARYGRWLETDVGKELCRQWQKWLTAQVAKYEWDITPEDVAHPTIHGLRGTGILLRYSVGHAVEQIANDIGMSRQMVDRYMRFKDQMEIAAAGPARLRVITGDR